MTSSVTASSFFYIKIFDVRFEKLLFVCIVLLVLSRTESEPFLVASPSFSLELSRPKQYKLSQMFPIETE